jgi:hypothetical protein
MGVPLDVEAAFKCQAVTQNDIPDELNNKQHHRDNLKFSKGKFTSKFKLR